MPIISESLERLFQEAGRAEQARLRRERQAVDDRAREATKEHRRRERAAALAPDAASRIWAWLEGPLAVELRARMHSAHLEELMILGWLDAHGRHHRDAYYHRWRVLLTTEACTLRVCRIGSQAGGGIARDVTSRDALVRQLPPAIVVALAHAVDGSGVLRTVRRSLQQRLASSDPPGVVRVL